MMDRSHAPPQVANTEVIYHTRTKVFHQENAYSRHDSGHGGSGIHWGEFCSELG